MRFIPMFLALLSFSSLAFFNEQHDKPALFAQKIGKAIFRFYSNHNIDDENNHIKRLIVVIQGNKRDAEGRMLVVQKELEQLQIAHETLVISPSFKIDVDKLLPHEPYWKNAGWKQGDRSQDDSRISSFRVLDELITYVLTSNKFPALSRVVISGHSAGGQVTHRYALTSMITKDFLNTQFAFVVMNPSSYTYLNAQRPYVCDPQVSKTLKYDDYKYGLNKRNAYSSSRSNKQLQETYLAREVYYVLGQADCDPQGEDLDLREEAMMQGPHRLSRGYNYFQHIQTFGHNKHHYIEIPGVGHDAAGMYGSAAVKDILFEI